jgi:hypothetical protein
MNAQTFSIKTNPIISDTTKIARSVSADTIDLRNETINPYAVSQSVVNSLSEKKVDYTIAGLSNQASSVKSSDLLAGSLFNVGMISGATYLASQGLSEFASNLFNINSESYSSLVGASILGCLAIKATFAAPTYIVPLLARGWDSFLQAFKIGN